MYVTKGMIKGKHFGQPCGYNGYDIPQNCSGVPFSAVISTTPCENYLSENLKTGCWPEDMAATSHNILGMVYERQSSYQDRAHTSPFSVYKLSQFKKRYTLLLG